MKTVIIDDEKECIEDLEYLISKHDLPLDVVATASSGNEGLAAILKHKPQIVFLDVVMPGMTGFEMLELLPELNFQLIITTSKDEYAIQAIRSSAIDFLLKPVKAAELKDAVDRAQKQAPVPDRKQIGLLSDNMKQPSGISDRIALVIKEGVQLVRLEDIIYFKSDGNYTTVFMTDGNEMVVSKPIRMFEEMVAGSTFYRVHNSYIVNIAHVEKFIRSDGGYVVMDNASTVPVSRSRKDKFLEILGYS
jgi:two-component system LytT family response regulator